MTQKHGTYRSTDSKTATYERDYSETRPVNCYRCGEEFISHQFDVRMCDKCRQLPEPLRVPELDFTVEERKRVNEAYIRIMKKYHQPLDIFDRSIK